MLSTLSRVSRRVNLAARKDELARARTRAVDSPDIQRDLIRRHSNPPRASHDHFRPPSHPPVHVFERDHLSCELATSTTCCKTRRSYRSGEALFEIRTLHDRGHDGLDAVPCSGVQRPLASSRRSQHAALSHSRGVLTTPSLKLRRHIFDAHTCRHRPAMSVTVPTAGRAITTAAPTTPASRHRITCRGGGGGSGAASCRRGAIVVDAQRRSTSRRYALTEFLSSGSGAGGLGALVNCRRDGFKLSQPV